MTQFAVQEGLIQTAQTVIGAYGLKSLSGSDGELDVKEDLQGLCKGYTIGDDIAFTGTFKAVFDPEKKIPEEDETVIDAEVAVEDETVGIGVTRRTW